MRLKPTAVWGLPVELAGDLLAQPPAIHKAGVLASKLPASAAQILRQLFEGNFDTQLY